MKTKVRIWNRVIETDQYLTRRCDVCKASYSWSKNKVNAVRLRQRWRHYGFTCEGCARKQAKKDNRGG
jgi:hypothetical protein